MFRHFEPAARKTVVFTCFLALTCQPSLAFDSGVDTLAGEKTAQAPQPSTVAASGNENNDAPILSGAQQTPLTVESGAPELNKPSGNNRISEEGQKEEPLPQDISCNAQGNDVGLITEKILRKEIDFLKLNTNYRMFATPTSKWKPWRTFLFQEATGALATAGAIHITGTRWRYWQRPALASKGTNVTGPILLLTAHSVGLAGLLVEAACDMVNDWKCRKKGFDAKTCDRRAVELKNDIEKLLAEREEQINNDSTLTEQQRQILASEGSVISDVKDCAVLEFSKLRGRAGKLRLARHVGNAMMFTNWTTGGYIGALMGVLAAMNRKPKLVGTGGVGFIVSGSSIILNPWVTKLATNVAGKFVAKKEKKLFGQINLDALKNFDTDRKILTDRLALVGSDAPVVRSVLKHASIYKLKDEVLDRQAELARSEAQKANREWKERCVASALIGGVKLNWGVQLVNAGYNWTSARNLPVPTVSVKFGASTFKVPISRTPLTKGQIFTRRVGVAGITYIPGNVAIVLDGLQSRVRGEIASDKQKKSGKAPGQILKQRMDTLDKMEQMLE